MILATHALVGAALGRHIRNPWILTIIALPLHYLLDTLRHGEYLNQKSTFKNTWYKVVLDLVVGLVLIFAYILYAHPSQIVTRNILWGSFISMFPDLLTVLYWKLNFKFLKKAYQLNKFVHSRFKENSQEREWNWRNSLNDILISLIALIILIFNF